MAKKNPLADSGAANGFNVVSGNGSLRHYQPPACLAGDNNAYEDANKEEDDNGDAEHRLSFTKLRLNFPHYGNRHGKSRRI